MTAQDDARELVNLLLDYYIEQRRRCEARGLCVRCKGNGERPAWGGINDRGTRPLVTIACDTCTGTGRQEASDD